MRNKADQINENERVIESSVSLSGHSNVACVTFVNKKFKFLGHCLIHNANHINIQFFSFQSLPNRRYSFYLI
jgi:hypothetical protein